VHGTWIIVSTKQHVIVVYKDGKKLHSITSFSVGGKHQGVMHPTPAGQFTVLSKDAAHVSHSYKTPSGQWAPMPFYVQFYPKVGFHVGDPARASHGCIHLTKADAEFIFKNAEPKKTHVWVLRH
jgi:lipoprotein-anchoring transpeptidase ErfK/SrfK